MNSGSHHTEGRENRRSRVDITLTSSCFTASKTTLLKQYVYLVDGGAVEVPAPGDMHRYNPSITVSTTMYGTLLSL